jgi:hypothetical protein
MLFVLITSLAAVGIIAVVFYFSLLRPSRQPEHALPPAPSFAGLFEPKSEPEQSSELRAQSATELRSSLLERAAKCEHETLIEAYATGDAALYEHVADTLLDAADSDAKLASLASYVTSNELPVGKKLAAVFVESCRRSLDRGTTAQMLHIAALSDDAEIFNGAVAEALQHWRDGKLPSVSAAELRALFDAEFWVLSSSTRSSGAGFILKRTLASARRELEVAYARQMKIFSSSQSEKLEDDHHE